MVDYSKLQTYTGANSFKNTGVFTTSVVFSGNILASQELTFTSVVTLAENQVFAFAIANYVEFTKGGSASWQPLPSFDVSIPTTPIGGLTGYLLSQVNNNVVTFIGGIRNPYGTTETITGTTVNIRYVTYTLNK